jgi:sigma-B regulation protein RsbU (phosphoserine phosphatase)
MALWKAENAEAIEFGRGRLSALMRDTAKVSPQEAVDHIVDAVQGWAKSQGDDLTIMVCDYAGLAHRVPARAVTP